jgi:hypothetical protein
VLAEAYHQRWEHETGNKQLKTCLRGPGKVLRSKSPDMVRQEIYGYLLTHHAISALIWAATEAGIDPDRVKFKRTVPIARRWAADPAAHIFGGRQSRLDLIKFVVRQCSHVLYLRWIQGAFVRLVTPPFIAPNYVGVSAGKWLMTCEDSAEWAKWRSQKDHGQGRPW